MNFIITGKQGVGKTALINTIIKNSLFGVTFSFDAVQSKELDASIHEGNELIIIDELPAYKNNKNILKLKNLSERTSFIIRLPYEKQSTVVNSKNVSWIAISNEEFTDEQKKLLPNFRFLNIS